MATLSVGASTSTKNLRPIEPKAIQANGEYIWEYGATGISFSFISDENLLTFMRGWLKLKEYMAKLDPTTAAEPPVEITGVTIDKTTGHIWVRGKVKAYTQISEAGVNPWAVLAVIGGLFAVIGIAVTLRTVYLITGGGGSGAGKPDPCTTPGITNYLTCLARKSGWFAFGAAFGALAILVLIILSVGRAK